MLIFPKKGCAFTRSCAGRILFIITTVIIYIFKYIIMYKYIFIFKYKYKFIYKYIYKYKFIYKYIYIVQTPAKSNI